MIRIIIILSILLVSCEPAPQIKGIVLNKYTDWTKVNRYLSVSCDSGIYIQPINDIEYINYNIGDTILIDY